jgi:hypothetical protein
MGQHSSNGSPEDTGRSTVVNESSAGVCEESLSEELGKFDFVSEEGSCDIDTLCSNYSYSLT